MKIFLDKYTKKYPNLPADIVADIVLTICDEAPDSYFSYEMVQERSDLCAKCGACCRQRGDPCRYFNGRTCDDYGARFDVCAEFPFYTIDDKSGLWLDPGCKFALRLADIQIEKEIKRTIDFLEE